MIVSWNWLKEYVSLDASADEFARRLMMAGLNHESTEAVGDDLAIDLEVTSNRPDCLGQIGVAREAALLFHRDMKIPAAAPAEGKTTAAELAGVSIDCPDLCSRYIARVIRGVRVGPSPGWMQKRLATLGIAAINNIVDISNYVLMECGQPLHAFDYAKLRGPEIIVRRPRPGETIEAIDHKTYALEPDMCVIADARVAVAIAGVMGGASTEVSPSTTAVLIESAEFDPISIRTTARRLNLHSDSSHRFERRVDPEGIEWASRRCCELILELAGGELAAGSVDVGPKPAPRQPITLRFSQLERILGIDVPADRVRRILAALGCRETPSPLGATAGLSSSAGNTVGQANRGTLQFRPVGSLETPCVAVIPPSWRRDLSREIDLVEEVARIDGYENIPEDVGVPMAASARTREDRAVEKVRFALTAAGVDEAMTLSVVDEMTAAVFSPWSNTAPLRSLIPVLRGADRLRTSLVPSLLAARRSNEALGNDPIELFEIARVYLPRADQLPEEARMIGLTSGRDYLVVKGIVEAVAAALNPTFALQAEAAEMAILDPQAACRLFFDGQMIGYVGRLTPEGLGRFDLRGATTVAEVRLGPLIEAADLVPGHVPLSPYPAVTRDVNLVVAEAVRWAEVAATVRRHAGANLEDLEYRDTYRDPARLGPGQKSLLFSIVLRSKEGTLTSVQADAVRDRVVAACGAEHGAALRA